MEFLRNNKKIFFWILIVICIISIILTATYKYKPSFFNKVVSPIIIVPQNIISNVDDWASTRKLYKKDNEQLVTTIEQLEDENDALKMENDRLKLLKEENETLSKLLEMKESYPEYEQVSANIISKEPNNWYNTFIIDVGTNDGIKPNMVVMTVGGLVGKVVECSGTYSKVVAIIDDTSSVSGIVTRNDALGFVKGDLQLINEGVLRMEYFDIDAEVMESDEIVTSHLSDIYPKGIPIGFVSEVYTDSTGLSKYAKIVPYVDFNNIKNVIVIKEDFTKDLSELEGE